MADDTAKIERRQGEQAASVHFCEFPGCSKSGGLGYDLGRGQSQWFCNEHRWGDYTVGKARRMFFDDEAAGIDAIMSEPRTAPLR